MLGGLQDAMQLYVLQHSQAGDPWEFMGVYSKQQIVEVKLMSGDFVRDSSDLCCNWKLTRVDCDDNLYGNLTDVPWSVQLTEKFNAR